MENKYFPSIAIFLTSIVIIIDKFTYDGWQWIVEHESCKIGGIEQICWGVSPFPAYLFTLIAFLITCFGMWYDYQYVKWYLYERNNKKS